MMTITKFKGEEFLIYSELIEKTGQLVSEKPLTPSRLEDIRHQIENEWVNTNIKYSLGGEYFSNQMFEYYLHKSFELMYYFNIN